MSGHERERLSAFLDGELPEAERAEVAAHLAACVECRGLLAALAEVDRAVVAPGDLPVPTDLPAGYFDGFAARVRDRIEAQARPARGLRRLPAWGWALAAALLLAVVTPLTLERHPAPGPAAERSAPAPVLASAPSGPVASGPVASARAPSAPLPAADNAPVAGHAVRDRQVAQGQPEAAGPARTPPAAARGFAPPPTEAPTRAPGTAEAKGELAAPAPTQERAAGELTALQTAASEEGRAAARNEAEAATRLAAAGGAAGGAAGRVDVGVAAGARSDALSVRPDLEFRRLDAVHPASREEWLAQRERWRAFAAAFPGTQQADEARVRVVACGLAALHAGGGDDVRAVLRRDAGEYLARPDARQKPRVRALLEAAANR